MSNLFSMKREIDDSIFGAPANILVRTVGYADDYKAMLVQVVNDPKTEVNYLTRDTEFPPLMKVTLSDIDDNIAKSLRGKRATIANRADKTHLGHLKGDATFGGICFLQGVKLHSNTSQEAYLDGGEEKTGEFVSATARWINGAIKEVTDDKPQDEQFKPVLGAAVSVQYREANERNGSPYGKIKVLIPRTAHVVKNITELETIVAKVFERNMPKIVPMVAVRVSDGKDAIYREVVRVSKEVGGEYPALSGKEYLEHLKSTTRHWRAIEQYVEFATQPGNEHCTIEVIPGFCEYMSKDQIENSNLFQADGKFVNKEKGEYYRTHWSINTGANREGVVDAYYESDVIIKNIDKPGQPNLWVIAGNEPVKGGVSSCLGSVSMFKTAAFSPNETMQELIDKFKSSRQKEAKAESTPVSEAINNSPSDIPNTADNSGFQSEDSFEPPVNGFDDADDDFEPEPMQ